MSAPLPGLLRDAADRIVTERVALSHLADAHGTAAQGSLLVLLAAPCVLPVPGIGATLGTGVAVLAAMMWRGRSADCLPARVATIEISRVWAQRVLRLLALLYALAGRWSRARWPALTAAGSRPWLAAKVGLMALIIVLPIPFGNVLPAASLILLGFGLALRDGVAVLLGWGLAALAVAFPLALGVAAWYLGAGVLTAWLPG